MLSINPFTGQVICDYKEYSYSEVEKIIHKVDQAFHSWKQTSFEQRAVFMKNLQARLLVKKEELAGIIVSEMGKVKREAIGEIEKCASVCGYYAENAESFLKNKPIKTEASEAYISYQPIGTVFGRDALEFPVLAGISFSGTCSHGGQYGCFETRFERFRLCIGHRTIG